MFGTRYSQARCVRVQDAPLSCRLRIMQMLATIVNGVFAFIQTSFPSG